MFSANIGFLFTDRPLAERVRASARAGFDAVECHYPFAVPPADLSAILAECDTPLLGLNTLPGDLDAGEFGLCAVPGREEEARAAIEQAVGYGAAVGATNVHVMAGRTGNTADAEETYRSNLRFACACALDRNMTILIEPINQGDVPGYHLSGVDHALDLIDVIGMENLKLMFDCYHVEITHGDVLDWFRRALPVIGHVQIAAVPDRGEPDRGRVDYIDLIARMRELGFAGPIGAEYKPRGASVEAGLGWLAEFRRMLPT